MTNRLFTENKNIKENVKNDIFLKQQVERIKSDSEKFANKDIRFSDKNIQSSVSLARCAYDKYLKGEYGDSSNISPLYLRKSQAERAMLEQ